MNKTELVDAVAHAADLSKAAAARAVGALFDAIAKSLKSGDVITLVGFGTFGISKRSARKGRNPQTGKVIQIAAKKVVRFRAGTDLSKKVK